MTSADTALFDSEFLKREVVSFLPDSINDLQQKKAILQNWIAELNSGRIENSNEDEVKPRFLHEVFGNVLGYSFDGAEFWNARPEFKTFVDATRADAALGFFTLDQNTIKSRVVAVVEIKGFDKDLDKTKNHYNQTTVEQAFGYAHKTGASWVIVSNFKELRLYDASFSGRWHSFLLTDLEQEDRLNAFFLLLHKHSLIDGPISRVRTLYSLQESYLPGAFTSNHFDENDHILDQMWKSLKQFEGIRSIDPYIISNIKPFNILPHYVWHYNHFSLLTLNSKIYGFLTGLTISQNRPVELSEDLKNELINANVSDFQTKIEYVLNILKHASINTLSAVKNYQDIVSRKTNVIGFSLRHMISFSEKDGVSVSIPGKDGICDCANCTFHRLDMRSFLLKLRTTEKMDLDSALLHYHGATDNYKKTFELYSGVITDTSSDPTKKIESFIAHYNRNQLFWLLDFYDDPTKETMLNKIRAVDLDEILYREFIPSERTVREALKEMRNEHVQDRVNKNITSQLDKLREVKETYDHGGEYHAVPNYTSEIHFNYYLLHFYVYKNGLINSYRSVTSKMLEGILLSHSIKEYPYRITKLSLLHILEPTLQLQSQQLDKLLAICPSIVVSEQDLTEYINRLDVFLKSFYDFSLGKPYLNDELRKQLLLTNFRDQCANIFSNAFQFLSHIEITAGEWNTSINTSLIHFLEVTDFLRWYHFDKLGKFLVAKGFLFTQVQLQEILKIANNRNEYGITTYPPLIKSCSEAIQKYYPNARIKGDGFIYKALAGAIGDNERLRYQDLLAIYPISEPRHQLMIKTALDQYLETTFNADCYQHCVHKEIYQIEYKDYFERYVREVQRTRGKGLMKIEDFKPEFQDFIFYNFVILINRFDIPRTDSRFRFLENLSPFENWLFDPMNYDYTAFDPQWLIAADNYYIQERMRVVDGISERIHLTLMETFNSRLSEIYFTVLTKKTPG